MPLVSIVVPAYNEEEALGHLHGELARVASTMHGVDFEFLYVDDGSTDGTLRTIKQLRAADPRVRFVSFSRNFGKESAMLAGFRHARGDYVAPLDADLQDPPTLLPEMYRALTEEGYDCAAARRTSRHGEGRVRSLFAEGFYLLFNRMSKTQLLSGERDFRLMSRQMLDAVLELCEVNRFTKGLLNWVGFKTKWLEYKNVERVCGKTKWSFFGLMRYSIEGFVDFSTAPLQLASAIGFLLCAVAAVWVLAIVVRTLAFGNPTPGWSSLACIVLFTSGMQFLTIGILGEYLARTYLETKDRPSYVVRETEE